MTDSTRYYYRDFITGKLRYTRGRFTGWTKPTGPLNVRYAQFERGSDWLFVPYYLLTSETKDALPKPEMGESDD